MPTLTPTGILGKSLAGLGYLVASSAAFQALVGESTAATALRHVHLTADDTAAGQAPRPRCVICPLDHGRARTTQGAGFSAQYGTLVSFETIHQPADSWWDATLRHLNAVEAILAECLASQGLGTGYFAGETHVAIESFNLIAGPSLLESQAASGEEGEQGQTYWGTTYQFTLAGL